MGSALHEVIANGVLPIVLVLFDLVGGLSEVSVVRYLSLLLLLRIFSKTNHALVRPVSLVVGGCGAETWGGASCDYWNDEGVEGKEQGVSGSPCSRRLRAKRQPSSG
jgi:hypothetical protein